MDFSYSPEQEDLRRLAADVFGTAGDAGHLQTVESGSEWFDRELWQRLAATNLLAVTVPVDEGGLGFGLLEACLVIEQCGRTLGHVPLVATLVGGVLPVAHLARGDLRGELLSGVVSGETVLSVGMGSAGRAGGLEARASGDEWRLRGSRPFVPYGQVARAVVVSADAEQGPGLFLVLADAQGVSWERQTTMSGDPQCILSADGAPARCLAAPGPTGDGAVHWLEQHLQVAYCALELGIAEAALAMTARYSAERVQFGRPIATFQAVGHRLADCYIDVLAMRWTLLEAAAALDAGAPADEAVCTAKWWACEGGHRVISAAQHCHGGVGVDMSYPLYRYFLRSKEVEVTLGSAAQQLAELGRLIADAPAGSAPASGPNAPAPA